MEKKLYLIKNIGCDDVTLAVLELTPTEVEYLTKIFNIINENSEYSCQPTIHIDTETKIFEVNGNYKNTNEYGTGTNDWAFDTVYSNGKTYKY